MPRVDTDQHLSEAEEQQLWIHYGLDYGTGYERGTTAGYTDTADRDGDGVYDEIQGTAVGRDTSGPTTDDPMTRSEEELRVGTAQRERGRARLCKYVVTETQQVTVPVQREEVRVEREPVTDANIDVATGGPAISEEEHEVTLHEEEPVVEKRVVPASGCAWTPRPSATSVRSPRRSARSRSRSTATRTASAADAATQDRREAARLPRAAPPCLR